MIQWIYNSNLRSYGTVHQYDRNIIANEHKNILKYGMDHKISTYKSQHSIENDFLFDVSIIQIREYQ